MRINQTKIIKNLRNYHINQREATAPLPKNLKEGICNALMSMTAVEFFTTTLDAQDTPSSHKSPRLRTSEEKYSAAMEETEMTQLLARMSADNPNPLTLAADSQKIIPYLLPCCTPAKCPGGIGLSPTQLFEIIKFSAPLEYEKIQANFKSDYEIASLFDRKMLTYLVENLIQPNKFNLMNTHNHIFQITKMNNQYFILNVNRGVSRYKNVKKLVNEIWDLSTRSGVGEQDVEIEYEQISIALRIYSKKQEAKEAFGFIEKNTFVQRLVEKEILESKGPDDKTALIFAAQHGDVDTVKAILQARPTKSFINGQDAMGKTALRLACTYTIGQPIVHLLAFHPATHLNKSTPLGNAVIFGQTKSVEYLISAAIKKNQSLQVNTLEMEGIEKDHDVTPLMMACSQGFNPIISLLLSYRDSSGKFVCEINLQNTRGETALHIAAGSRQLEAVITLLKRPDIQPGVLTHCTKSRKKCGCSLSPMMYALGNFQFRIADMIFYHPNHYSLRRNTAVFMLIAGAGLILGSLFKPNSDSKDVILVSTMNPIVFLLSGILFHQILNCVYKQQYDALSHLLPLEDKEYNSRELQRFEAENKLPEETVRLLQESKEEDSEEGYELSVARIERAEEKPGTTRSQCGIL